jgi:hypothetical protein
VNALDALELAAMDRYKAYQRRWRVGRMLISDWDWAVAYVRRSKVLERRRAYEPPQIVPVGNLRELLERCP